MKKIIISILSALTITSTAFADNTAWNQHVGSYAELNAGTNVYLLGVVSSAGSTTGAGITGAGWSGALGYNFTPSFGLEAGFMQNYVNINQWDHTNVPYVSTRFTVPMGDRFSFIGKIGAGYYMQASDISGGVLLPYTGVGFGYALTPNLDITTQYQGLVFGVANAGLLSLGITYHF